MLVATIFDFLSFFFLPICSHLGSVSVWVVGFLNEVQVNDFLKNDGIVWNHCHGVIFCSCIACGSLLSQYSKLMLLNNIFCMFSLGPHC